MSGVSLRAGKLPYDLERTTRVVLPVIAVALFICLFRTLRAGILVYAAWVLRVGGHVSTRIAGLIQRMEALDSAWPSTIFYLVVCAAVFVALSIWTYQAVSNAQAAAPRDNRIPPGLAALSPIIPVVGVFLQYHALKETWHTALSRDADINASGPVVLRGWLCSLLALIASGLMLNIYPLPDEIGPADLMTYALVALATGLLKAAAAALLIVIMDVINDAEQAHINSLAFEHDQTAAPTAIDERT